MRVLVLGGTRFIGLALVEELLGAGHTVAIVHRGEHEPDDLPPTVEHRRSPASPPTPPSTSPR
jgi:nucleoside-diphosphate-sugar epimerase